LYDQDEDAKSLTRDDLLKIQVTRTQVEKWCHAPFFEDTIKGSIVRIGLGNDPRTRERVYRIAQVAGNTTFYITRLAVVEYHKVYQVGSAPVKIALSLTHGKAKRTFTMDILSNSPFTEVRMFFF
jgi:RNA polymerase-associated protein RTF1